MTAAFFAVLKHNGQNQFALDEESHRTIITTFILLRFLAIYKRSNRRMAFRSVVFTVCTTESVFG